MTAVWISLIMNGMIVAMVAFGFYSMFSGWDFMGKEGEMESSGAEMFRFFTIDSNLLAGLISLVMMIAEIRVLCGASPAISPSVYTLKLMGASAVMLTFMVTVFFLVPQFKNPMALFYNSNLFFHLLVPVMAAVSFVCVERHAEIPFPATLIGALPTALYAIFYVNHIFRHLKDGKVDPKYDFYNFLGGKKERAPVVVPIILIISYGFSLLLWLANRIG